MAPNKNIFTALGRVVFAMVAFVLILDSVCAMNLDQLTMKDVPEESSSFKGSKFVSAPNSLVRFLFYNARPLEHQSGGLYGYKRSSSALDALTGITLGKRSGPSEYLNLDAFYNRQYGMRSAPRMYDMRWAPLDSYDAPVAPEMS